MKGNYFTLEMIHATLATGRLMMTKATRTSNITKTRLFKYKEKFTSKTENFQIKNSDIFLYFCSKQRLWVLARTALARGSDEYPQSMFLSKRKKNNVYLLNPSFTI